MQEQGRAISTLSCLGLPPDESRVVALNDRSIDIPGQALPNEVRWCPVDGVRKRSFGQCLEGDRGHVEKKLPQVGATSCASKVPLDGMAPARPHGASNHLLHGSSSHRAFRVRHVIHCHSNLAHHKTVVDRHPYRQLVNRLSGLPNPFPRDVHGHSLRVAHFGLNIPQVVGTLKAAVNDVSSMQVGSGLGWWQWQIRTSFE